MKTFSLDPTEAPAAIVQLADSTTAGPSIDSVTEEPEDGGFGFDDDLTALYAYLARGTMRPLLFVALWVLAEEMRRLAA